MHIHNIFSFFKRYKVFFLIGLFFAGIFAFGLDSVFAEGNEPVISSEDSAKVVKILNGFITGAAALMGMVTSFITMFLYPGWVNGTLFGLQDYLKIMWILISNVVYFIFAFILIAIAFMNIIGKGEGTWELKQAMPKFIVGVLIVPFSWFFVQFILSLSAILTVGVLTLPYDSFQGTSSFDDALENVDFAGKEICKDIVISFNGDFSKVGDVTQLNDESNDLDEHIKCKKKGKITIKELLTLEDENGDFSSDASGLQNSVFSVMSIYSYGILSIDKLDTITGSDLESVESIADLVFKIVFDVLFIAVYLLLMIALLLALFVRGVRLWIYMMLSPTFGLLYFFGSEGVGDGDNKFSIKEFIALALVPVYVSAALAFGLVFIMVASEGITKANKDVDTLEAGGFSLTIVGAHAEGESEASVIAKLIVEIFGIVILWIAVMAALNTSTTTSAIIKPIADFGGSVGKLAAAAPTYAPIIPTGGGPGTGLSATGLASLGSSIEAAPRAAAQKRGQTFADKFTEPGMVENVNRVLASSESRQIENGETLKKTLSEMGPELFKNSNQRKEAISNINEKLGLEINIDGLTDPTKIALAVNKAMSEKNKNYNATFDSNNTTEFITGLTGNSSKKVDINLTTTDVSEIIKKETDSSGVEVEKIDASVLQTLKTEIGDDLTDENKEKIREAIRKAKGGTGLTGDQITTVITELLK